MSNWERRPLRLSQEHYAALDAYTLIDIFDFLQKELSFKEVDISCYSKSIEEVKEGSPKPKKSKKPKEDYEPKNEQKPEKVFFGLKVIISDSLKDSLPKSQYKFYGDSMMKNMMTMMTEYGFDAINCPVKLKRNQFYDDSELLSKDNRIFVTKAPKRFKQYADRDAILVICQVPNGVIIESYKQFNEVMKALDIPIQAEPTFQEISQVPIESKTINSTLEINSTLNPTSEVALTLTNFEINSNPTEAS